MRTAMLVVLILTVVSATAMLILVGPLVAIDFASHLLSK